MDKMRKDRIISSERLSKDIARIKVYSPKIARSALPGQFINIKCGDGVLLRRPISICTVDNVAGSFDIVFQTKGKGTEYLSNLKKDDELDFLGPLGKPFHTAVGSGCIAVVGGGIGIFPLLFLLERLKRVKKLALLGFRSKECVIMEREFTTACDVLKISTDDGSYGHKGNAGDLLDIAFNENKIDIVYACGPVPMIKKVLELSEKNSIKCQVSLEQRMGCGIGACLVCACKINKNNDWDYGHVCKDGPVFWSNEIIIEN